MSSLVYKVHAQVLFFCISAPIIIAVKLSAFVYVETSLQTSLVVLLPGRPPALELRKRLALAVMPQPPFGD